MITTNLFDVVGAVDKPSGVVGDYGKPSLWRHRLCRRWLRCRRLRLRRSLPLRDVAAVTSLGRVAIASGDDVCGLSGCVAIACGGAVRYRVWDVTAVTSPGCVATACGLAVCCRCWASPLVSSSVASSPLARAPFTAVGRHRLCRLVTPPLVASSVASSPPATAPFTTVAGRRRRDVSELRCHRLWRRRVQPSGCVAIACGGAVYYRDGASLLWRLLRHHRLW